MDHYAALFSELEEKLEEVAKQASSPIARSAEAITSIVSSLRKLKEMLSNYSFGDESDEIYFFKTVKPKFTGKLMFYMKIYKLESRMPAGGLEARRKFIQKEMDKIKNFFSENMEFYEYYRSGSDYLDHVYFVRDQAAPLFYDDPYYFEKETTYTTGYDYKVAKIIANSQYEVYLQKYLHAFDNGTSLSDEPAALLNWTANKSALIELVYAFHSVGAFNNGNADVKQIAIAMEKAFGIQLGNIYRTYQELIIRKKNRTNFLDLMKQRLEQRMDESY